MIGSMAPIIICDPDPGWAAEFADIAGQLHAWLGRAVQRIDHIGSTSVPGLPAKNILDLQATVPDETSLDAVLDPLAAAGWTVRGNRCDHIVPGQPDEPAHWRKRLVTEPEGWRRVNLHIRIDGRANQRYALLFRDYLRAHPTTAQAYGEFKRRAAELPFESTGAYADLKDPVCDLVYLPAEEWAARTGWTA
jgi:GrpB-like predicted nucleotidyltransferase (UPF0157 family)